MREKEVKLLWGRSGNRCAICKLELTLDGSRETLGEMAHIVARSSDGPRGASTLLIADRDCYDNLILLCPNHHSEVDKTPVAWTTERLRVLKAEHEEWISSRLRPGEIAAQPVDNTAFLQSRRNAWTASSKGDVALVISLTPLRVLSEVLDPLDHLVVKQLNSARVPDGSRTGSAVNRYDTRPTASGVVNQASHDNAGYGHQIEIFRVGHCEFFLELARGTKQIIEFARKNGDGIGDLRVVRYSDVAEGVEFAMSWLWSAWATILPFTYMTLSVGLTNTSNTILYSREGSFSRPLYGTPVTDEHLEYSDVIQRGTEIEITLLSALGRIANGYGLVLPRVYDDTGKHMRPEKMR